MKSQTRILKPPLKAISQSNNAWLDFFQAILLPLNVLTIALPYAIWLFINSQPWSHQTGAEYVMASPQWAMLDAARLLLTLVGFGVATTNVITIGVFLIRHKPRIWIMCTGVLIIILSAIYIALGITSY